MEINDIDSFSLYSLQGEVISSFCDICGTVAYVTVE